MFRWIKKILSGRRNRQAPKPLPSPPFIWCLVGNVVEERFHGVEKNIRSGTKHFSPGTRLYCFNVQWGDGYQRIRVIGRHRKSRRWVCLVMPSQHITNWRLAQVYTPRVIEIMNTHYNGWTSSDKDRETILGMLEGLNGPADKTPGHTG